MQKGVKCPRGYILHDECRRCVLQSLHPCPYTADILELMREENDEEPDGLAFSPSRLLDCPRKQLLMEKHDYYVDVKQAWSAVRGHMVHAIFEMRGSYPGSLLTVREVRLDTPIETRYGKANLRAAFGGEPEMEGEQFQGKPDLVVCKKYEHGVLRCKVVDYKSKKSIEHSLVEAVPEHQMQVNMYAFLVERALLKHPLTRARIKKVLGELPTGVLVDELEIVYLDMKRVRRFTSAGPLVDDGKMLHRNPPEYEQLILAPITLLSRERIEAFVRARIEIRLAGREKLPDVLPESDAWRCNFCPVAERCAELAREEQRAA